MQVLLEGLLDQSLKTDSFFALRMFCCCADSKNADEITIISKPERGLEKPEDTRLLQEKEVTYEHDGKQAEAQVKGEKEKEAVEPAGGETFLLQVTKENKKLGFNVETLLDDYCVVKSVNGSVKVKPYDRVLKVNGASKTTKELVKLMTDSDSMELEVQRPIMKDVPLTKAGKKLGLTVNDGMATHGLLVKSILPDGVASELPAGTIKAMDRIVAVDGTEGSPQELMKELVKNDSFVLKICSYA